ncbi:MAG: carbonic anhydrase, partial [Betaproteobacteria bacterium]
MKTVEITYRYDASGTETRERPTDAAAARARLNEGSRSTSELLANLTEGTGTTRRVIHVDPRDLGIAHGESVAPMQRPYAAILGCADARVPVEIIFNEGPNDLFVVRVAGNGLGSEVMG